MGVLSRERAAVVDRQAAVSTSHGRIPSLHGLRAIAVLSVMIAHYFVRTRPGTDFVDRLLSSEANLGVGLFFAISGFLITRLLLIERAESGRIHLWRFYARRAVRLWPALWALIAVTVGLGAAGLLVVDSRDVLGAIFFTTDYTANIGHDPSQVLFHTWSLAVEEQFYLLWPAVLLLVGVARARKVLLWTLVAAPAVRILSYVAMPAWRDGVEFQFHSRFDVLAAGCLLAMYWNDPRLQEALRRYRASLLVGAVSGVAFTEILHAKLTSEAFMLLVGYSIESIALATLVGVAITSATTRGGRVLNGKVLVHIGLISYSLYLWQEMFILTPFGIFHIVPLGAAAAFACAEMSWRTLERPLEPLRRVLHPRRA